MKMIPEVEKREAKMKSSIEMTKEGNMDKVICLNKKEKKVSKKPLNKKYQPMDNPKQPCNKRIEREEKANKESLT